MIILRYCLSELKRLSEVVIEQLYLLWSETALCGDVPRGGETCREFGVCTNPVIQLFQCCGVVDVRTICLGKLFFCCIDHSVSGFCFECKENANRVQSQACLSYAEMQLFLCKDNIIMWESQTQHPKISDYRKENLRRGATGRATLQITHRL